MALTAAEILAVEDRIVRKVEAKEWGGEVYVRSLSTDEAIKLNESIEGVEDTQTLMAAQLAAFMCDEKGTALFDNAQAALPLMSRSHKVLNRVLKEGQGLNHAGSLEDEKQK